MPYAQLDSLRLYYEEYAPTGSPEPPSGETEATVLLLHGFTLDRRVWTPQADYFGNRRRTILLDVRGHGLSDAPKAGYSRDDQVEDLARFVDILGIERFHLVGLSIGGATAIGYALKYQSRLVSLTLVSGWAVGWNIGRKISHVGQVARRDGIEAARQKWQEVTLGWYRQDQKEVRELIQLMMSEHSGAPWLDPALDWQSPESDLPHVPDVTIPTLLMAGGSDPVFLKLARRLNETMPNSRLSVYEGGGHILNLEKPERFNRELGNFLVEVEKR
ncbi:MAG: alpha/beta fold hydrolase [bacterium]